MIVLFTDFGLEGPYTGQVLAVLQREAPGIPVITLQADAPMGDPFSAAYLLAAYAPAFPAGSVFLCVVDPGVGGARPPLAVQADGAWFVGPGNGLFELVMRRAITVAPFVLTWQPPRLGASFHGRDLFAPVAARLACGAPVPGTAVPRTTLARSDWPEDLPAIVYVDRFGNGSFVIPPDADDAFESESLSGLLGLFDEDEHGAKRHAPKTGPQSTHIVMVRLTPRLLSHSCQALPNDRRGAG
ncbi:MAG: hypothetical protein FD149_2642 [Rhodospirillaceae bacterium]|nr:MAG: hypothetical protein FD149_2642 [Rhodospirillaceae bacterium]